MRAAALFLALLLCGAACGGESDCEHEPLHWTFDGADAGSHCTRMILRLETRPHTLEGHLFSEAMDLPVELPQLRLRFAGATVPQALEVVDEGSFLLEEKVPPFAQTDLVHRDATGPLRSRSGAAHLALRGDRVVVEFEGTMARRDDSERPFTARLEALVEIRCEASCDGPCPPAVMQLCDLEAE